MAQLIKILGERRSGAYRKVDGYSGKLYQFRWDQTLGAYVFDAPTQAVVDDLFSRAPQGLFAPIVIAGVGGAVGVPVNQPVPDLEQRGVMAEVLGNLGVPTDPNDTVDTMVRLAAAYDKGRSDVQAEIGKPVAAGPVNGPPEGVLGLGDVSGAPDVQSPAPEDAATPAAEAAPAAEPVEEHLTPQQKRVRTMARKKAEAEREERIAAGLEEPPAE